MEFFGVTQYGFTSPIKDMLRDGYVEPLKPTTNGPDSRADHRSYADKIRELDCYLGTVNGFAYGSHARLTKMREKNFFKPVGPTDMYKYPGANSMQFGWWNDDPVLNDLKKDDSWFKPRRTFSITTSEMSRYTLMDNLHAFSN